MTKQVTKNPRNAKFSYGADVGPLLERLVPGVVKHVEILSERAYLSMKVAGGGEQYKVAECRSETHARLAEAAITAAWRGGGPVPEFVGREGSVIATHWVEGKIVTGEPRTRQQGILLDCEQALHATTLEDQWREDARYVHLETLSERFREMAPAVFASEVIERILGGIWVDVPESCSATVVHPDLIPANVVMTHNGPVVIDNEAIAIGYGREFDVWHTAECLYGHRNERGMRRYVEAYQARCPLPALLERKSVWDRFRRLRRVMKAIEKGHRMKARWVARPLLAR